MEALVKTEALADVTEPFETLAAFVKRDGDELRSASLSWTGRFPSYLPEPKRDFAYHAGRIAYFVDRYQSGAKLEPMRVYETRDPPGHVYLDDGHHRLCAAMLVRRARVLIDWLGEDPALLRQLQTY